MVHDLSWWIQVSLSLLVIQVVMGSWWLIGPGKKLADGGWIWGRLSGWLAVALLVWWSSHLLPVNTVCGVRGIVVGLLVLIGVEVVDKREIWRKELKKKWRMILVEEILFVIGLVGLGLVRGFKPEILGLEKFMDAGFINGYLNSPSLPAEDMWLAGKSINYYSFGHFMGAVMLKWWGVGINVGYNLLMALLAGLILSGSFSVSVNLIGLKKEVGRKILLTGGLVSALLVTLGGNSHTIWYGIKNGGWDGYWYATATRFIENTIHEFVGYSLVVSDLHAHLWSVPFSLFLLLLLVGWYKANKRVGWEIGGGILIGVLAMINTWDVLVYGLLLFIWAGWLVIKDEIEGKEMIRAGIIILGVGGIVSAAWWMNFESISQGIEAVKEGSALWQLVALWGGHSLLTVLAIKSGWFRKNLLVVSLGIGAFVLILIPELMYVKDIYPTHPRANTMFKLTYQAMLWMSLLVGYVLVRGRNWEKLVVGLLSVCFLSFSWFSYQDFYYFKSYQGLDGAAWLKRESPNDWSGIEWLKNNAEGRPVILEAVGESYTKYGRVSVFSGLPTVLGWRVHEWLWRGGFEEVGKRSEEVRWVYEEPLSQKAEEVLEKYKIKYIFVGEKEKDKYQLKRKGLRDLGEVVFEKDETEIIKISD